MSIFFTAVAKAISAVLLIALLILSSSLTANLAHAQPSFSDFAEVDAYINETMRRLPIKGLALAVVQGEQILYMQGYGIANAQGDPATPQTPWPMGSVTKSFTALAIRQLAAAGKVSLNAPLQTYLPEFQLADPHAASAILIRDLLDHTSGISKQEGEAPYLNSPATTFTENLERLRRYRPVYRPGEHYEYSNWNYVLLAQVMSRTSGQSYVEYMGENIIAPLGMSHSSFADYDVLPHAATGNLITYGFSVPYHEEFVPGMEGASTLSSTAEDMAHYVSLFLGEGQYQDKSLLPATGRGSYGPMWEWIAGSPAPDTVYGLSGGFNSISTTCLTYPQQKVGVVLLLNTRLDQLPGINAYDIARGIGNIVLHRPYRAPASSALYKAWVILDVAVVLFIAAIIWQVSRLKGWRERYRSSRGFIKVLAGIGILLNLLVCTAILYLPTALGTRWDAVLFLRPDIGIPLMVIAALLGGIGLFKAARGVA